MLSQQLPALPLIDAMLGRVVETLAWIDEPIAPVIRAQVAPYPVRQGETIVAPRGGYFWNQGVSLEAVRFAGSNRLMVEFVYKGRLRRAEPYSLRRAKTTGSLLLYAWEDGASNIKAFNVAKMRDVRASPVTFVPRYRVEFG